MSKHYPYQQLYDFAHDIFTKMGCPQADATTACDTLLSADLRGVDSHGVARLSGYVRLWDKKRINATPDIKIVHETPSTAVVDGDAGLGLVVGIDVSLDVVLNVTLKELTITPFKYVEFTVKLLEKLSFCVASIVELAHSIVIHDGVISSLTSHAVKEVLKLSAFQGKSKLNDSP